MRNEPSDNCALPKPEMHPISYRRAIAKTFAVNTILFLIATTSTHCSPVKGRHVHNPDLQTVVDQALGSPNQITFNENGTFALCQQKPETNHARRLYRFVVIRVRDNAIVREGAFSMGYVKWINNKSIEVYSGSTSRSGTDGSKKIIHVNSPTE
jgi:hypothetical protein